jgi:insertion element IS1 protein InsB
VHPLKNSGKIYQNVAKQCAVAYTDFWESYKTVIPSQRHRAVGKETERTNHIERLNNTLRCRFSDVKACYDIDYSQKS